MDKKQLIIKSFLELVTESGSMKDISVKKISDKAGVGKGTIYEYFTSKEEIIKKAVEYMIDIMAQSFLVNEGYEILSFEESLKKYIDNIYQGSIIVNKFSKYNHHNINEILNYVDMKEVFLTKIKHFQKANLDIFKNNVLAKGVREGFTDNSLDDFDILIILKSIIRELTENLEFKSIDDIVLKNKLYKMSYKLIRK